MMAKSDGAKGDGTAVVPTGKVEETKESTTSSSSSSSKSSWDSFLFTPVDISPVVYLRIIFGGIMLWEVYRHFNGRKQPTLERYYMEPVVHIRYVGFEWMPGPLPGMYMYHFFAILGFLYLLMILGLWYRMVSILTCIGLFYWFCLDMFFWLNHLYFALMLNFILIFLPANRNASLDVLIHPELRVAKVSSWTMWLIKFTLAIPYIFGAISKIHMDWLRGEPMRTWAPEYKDEVPEAIRNIMQGAWWTPYFFSWGGLAFDLIIVPLLMYPPTRLFGSINAAFFHLMNDRMFHIGIFPWLMLFATPLYYEAETLRPILNFEWIFTRPKVTTNELVETPTQRKRVKFWFCLWFGFHYIWPWRHHLYPGDVLWTEEAYIFSWQMKMRDKSGRADFTVTYMDTGEKFLVDNSKFLIAVQQGRMPTRAEYILGYAHFLCDHYSENGERLVSVHVESQVAYNARDYQPLVRNDVNLCEQQLHYFKSSVGDWIVPMTTPFESKRKDTDARVEKEGLAKLKKSTDPKEYTGLRVAAYFDKNLHFGTILNRKELIGEDDDAAKKISKWSVRFDDGSRVKYSNKDLVKKLHLYSQKEHLDYKHHAREAEKARKTELAKKAEEARKVEEARLAEEARIADEARKAEEARLAEEARIAEEARKAEEARIAEEARKAEEARLAEEARIAEEARKAEEARLAEEARIAEEARKAEEARLAEEVRIAEEKRMAEEARLAEEARKSGEANTEEDKQEL